MGAAAGIGGAQESVSGVMGQIDAAELPDKLVDVEAAAQVPPRYGFAYESV